MKLRCTVWFVIALLAMPCLLHAQGTSGEVASPNDAVVPVPRSGSWMNRHEQMNRRVAEGDVDLIFVGDSITQGWEGAGRTVWEKYYGDRNAVNLGISGDRTQHVLWRLENGNVEGISPKLAVVMIGTNNAQPNTPAQTIEGVTAVVKSLREKLPKTKILLLAIFPRGTNDNDPLRKKNAEVNQAISKLHDGRWVFYLDINQKFLEPDGTLTREIMGDRLHPGATGYEIWAEAIEPMVVKLMSAEEEKEPECAASVPRCRPYRRVCGPLARLRARLSARVACCP